MSTVGTISQVYDNRGNLSTNIAGVTNGNSSAGFTQKGSIYSSFVVFGTFGAGGSCQFQGSNDGGVHWENLGSVITQEGQGTFQTTTVGGQVLFDLYRLNCTAGDGTTSLSAAVIATLPR